MLASWSSTAKHALDYAYTMSFETSCSNRRLKTSLPTDDRDSLRFHWIKDREILETVVLRFTRLMFGLYPSLFAIEDTIKHKLERYKKDQPETVIELKQNMYVGDVT